MKAIQRENPVFERKVKPIPYMTQEGALWSAFEWMNLTRTNDWEVRKPAIVWDGDHYKGFRHTIEVKGYDLTRHSEYTGEILVDYYTQAAGLPTVGFLPFRASITFEDGSSETHRLLDGDWIQTV